MLKKCANPDCATPFKYLREGRLFRLRVDSSVEEPTAAEVRKIRLGERFWLCGACSSRFTLVSDGKRGVILAPFGKNGARKDKCIPILDLTARARGASR